MAEKNKKSKLDAKREVLNEIENFKQKQEHEKARDRKYRKASLINFVLALLTVFLCVVGMYVIEYGKLPSFSLADSSSEYADE